MVEHITRIEETRNAYGVLLGRSEGKKPSGKPRRRWEDKIKMDLKQVGCDAGTKVALLKIGTNGGRM